MKKLFAAALAVAALSTSAFADVTGTWNTAEGQSGGYAVVSIGLCSDGSGTYCGSIIDIVNNENRSSVGNPIITTMEDRGDGKFGGGRIWAPDEDEWYQSKMQLNGDTLTVSGCVAGGLICRGQDWTRAN